MTYTSTITDDQVFQALQAWIMDALGLDINHVIQELGNRVSTPTGGFVCMTRIAQKRLSTNVRLFTNAFPVETVTEQQDKDFVIQLDCYGPSASDWMSILTTAFSSSLGTQYFAPSGLVPLYHEDPTSAPLVNGEEQYEMRLLTRVHLQYNPAIVAPMTFLTIPKPTILDILTKP